MHQDTILNISQQYQLLQKRACKILDDKDGKGEFSEDTWQKEIGNGITRVKQNGNIIEKAAINFSHVSGKYTPKMAKMAGKEAGEFSACGVSSIIHPVNPHVPIIHMNVRYFQLNNGDSWFGGGIDLTPHYIIDEDARDFHLKLKETCDTYDLSFYPQFKKEADDYFYISHRNETRGIGGIFFDQLDAKKPDQFDKLFAFTCDLLEIYPEIYVGLMEKYGQQPYTNEEKEWQAIRRGRYVEFNLVYDRGTKFGLYSNGNTESILLSMPPEVQWIYNHSPKNGSREQQTIDKLKKGIDWISN